MTDWRTRWLELLDLSSDSTERFLMKKNRMHGDVTHESTVNRWKCAVGRNESISRYSDLAVKTGTRPLG